MSDSAYTNQAYKAFFNRAPIGMVILSHEGKIIYSNDVTFEITGYEIDELYDNYLSLFIHPDDVRGYMRGFRRLFSGETDHFKIESRFIRSGGEFAWWRLSVALETSTDGSAQFIFAMIEDISDRKRDEEELRKAKDAAEEATRTKSAFLANMTHEIRTPIHTIIGMTDLLVDTPLDDEQGEYASQVRFSADVLLSLINDILDFSKIEAGKTALEIIDIDLYGLVEEAVDLVTLEAHKKGLEVIIDIESSVPHLLRGDPVRLRQIIVNLFTNAVKFTPEGQIVTSLRLEAEDETAVTVRFAVSDTGIGIPADKVSRLFQAFNQADGSTTRKYGGTGLGLSISRHLAELMGGRIGVESTEGAGATFWFTVVLEKQQSPNLFADVPEDFYAGVRVLIVDDNRTVRDMLAGLIGSWGCAVDAAADGPAGLDLMRDAAGKGAAYDLAVVDLTLPGIDGWQFAGEVNADQALSSAKMILMNPAGTGTDAKMKLLKWFAGYLTKPLKKQALIETIFRVLHAELYEMEGEDVAELEAVEDLAGPQSLPAAAAPTIAPRRDAALLIAEDHEVNRMLFKTILSKLGYDADMAEDGQAAVERVEQKQYDLIFMDVHMPRLNGYEATGRIRELGVTTPIVAVTASAMQQERERCREAGMDDYLTKPFKREDLVPLLGKWLVEEVETAEEVLETESETETEPGDKVIFDFDEAVSTFMGQRDVVVRLLGAFGEKVRGQFETISGALRDGDMESVRLEAHAIKGGSWNLHAKRLGDKAHELEEAGRDGDADLSARLLEELRERFDEFSRCVAASMEA